LDKYLANQKSIKELRRPAGRSLSKAKA